VIARYVAANAGCMPYGAAVADANFRPAPTFSAPTVITVGGQADAALWRAFVGIVAPIVFAAPPAAVAVYISSGRGDDAEKAVAIDGGFSGPCCKRVTTAIRDRILVCGMTETVATFLQNHDSLVALGYVWDEKNLLCGDHKDRIFAVPTGKSGLKAMIHDGRFANGIFARYLTLISFAADGRLERIEAHPIYHGIATQSENWDCDPSVDGLMTLAGKLGALADPARQRLDQAAMISCLQNGEPLPPAIIGVDFTVGTTLPNGALDTGAYALYWVLDADSDHRMLTPLLAGNGFPEGCQESLSFSDDD
jgi:hypothetical protein